MANKVEKENKTAEKRRRRKKEKSTRM